MAKIILEFDAYEDIQDARCALKAKDLAFAIYTFQQKIREDYRYSEDEKTIELAEKYQQQFNSILNDYGIVIDDLIS